MIALVVHMAHDKVDADHISWAREITGTVLGGLMGLVTGRALASAAKEPAAKGEGSEEAQK
jgi:hypothetical protein